MGTYRCTILKGVLLMYGIEVGTDCIEFCGYIFILEFYLSR